MWNGADKTCARHGKKSMSILPPIADASFWRCGGIGSIPICGGSAAFLLRSCPYGAAYLAQAALHHQSVQSATSIFWDSDGGVGRWRACAASSRFVHERVKTRGARHAPADFTCIRCCCYRAYHKRARFRAHARRAVAWVYVPTTFLPFQFSVGWTVGWFCFQLGTLDLVWRQGQDRDRRREDKGQG